MRCEELAERVTDLLEGELGAAEETAALEHLATCERCEEVLTATREAVRVVHEHGRVELDERSRARIFDAIVSATELSAET